MLRLWKDETNFPACDQNQPFRRIEVLAAAQQKTAVFGDLPNGTHAISAMHDENGKLERNMIGMPKFGIKPYVWPYPIGKPSFAKIKFNLAGGRHKITNAVAEQRACVKTPRDRANHGTCWASKTGARMKRFIEGLDRTQTSLLPDCIDDYVNDDNPVRAIDAFVDILDLATLGFDVTPEATGRPGYHPSTMLKLYLYGYLNQVQSSRRLERECARNLELIWLTGRLKPDFKTIADFRRNNGPAIREVCKQFVALCRDIDLLDASVVAIDGSKFKAVNAKARSFTREKLRRRLGEIDEAITRYLGELDRADEVLDKTGMVMPEARISRVNKKLAHFKKEAANLRAIEQRMDTTGETQVSLTDPDARAMATTSKQPRVVGYNVQSVVETKHHLIVAHEVTNHGYDRDALSMMARAAKEVMASETIEAIADKGYYSGEEIVAAEMAGVAVTVSKPNTSNAGAAGRFDKPILSTFLTKTPTFAQPAND